MAEDSDGIEEAAEAQIRVLVTAAGHLGEHLARAREQALRRAEAASQTEARRARSHYEAEHRLARAELAAVYRADWWERATPLQVAHAYEVARTWTSEDPEAARAEQRITDEIRTRYGITPEDLRAQTQQTRDAETARQATAREVDRQELEAALAWAIEHDPDAYRAHEYGVLGTDQATEAQTHHDRLIEKYRQATQSQTERAMAQAEQAEAVLLLAQADHADRAAEETRTQGAHETDPDERAETRTQAAQHQQTAASATADAALIWDSAERRQATAHDLETSGVDPEIIETLMHADVGQAQPATQATTRSPARQPRARRGPSLSRGPQARRHGSER